MRAPAAVAVGGQAGVALGDLRAHVGDVEARHLADAGEDRDRRLGIVGVDVDLQRRAIADDEDGVAQRLQGAHVARRRRAAAPVTAKFVQ